MASSLRRADTDGAPADDTGGRREDILRTACSLFAVNGYHGVGMRAISEAVGIQPSSLYHWFPSKTDILYAIALEATESFIAAQLPRLEEAGSRRTVLYELFREHILYFHEHREAEAVALRELRQLDEERYREINAIRHRYQDAIRKAVADGAAAGELKVDDPFTATMAVLSVLNGVNDWFRERHRKTIEQVADECARMAIDRILGARPPRRARSQPAT